MKRIRPEVIENSGNIQSVKFAPRVNVQITFVHETNLCHPGKFLRCGKTHGQLRLFRFVRSLLVISQQFFNSAVVESQTTTGLVVLVIL